MPIFFILFVIVPIIELWLFIQVGSQIGALATIALVILTAAIGSFLLKNQGAQALRRAQQRAQQGQIPLKELGDGLFLAVGGLLLLTPGFLTDIVGCLCLLPGFRAPLIYLIVRKLIPKFSRNASFTTFTDSSSTQKRPDSTDSSFDQGNIFDGEYTRENKNDDKNLPRN